MKRIRLLHLYTEVHRCLTKIFSQEGSLRKYISPGTQELEEIRVGIYPLGMHDEFHES